MVVLVCKTCSKEFSVHEYRAKTARFCSKGCFTLKGIIRSQEFKDKVSRGMKGVNTWAKGRPAPHHRGANSHFWKGGVSEKNRTERQNFSRTIEYINFRREVLKRDNYTCQICQQRTKKGQRVVLQVDHIKPYALYPELRLDLDNARTVCKPCHYKTDTFGAKVYQYIKEDSQSETERVRTLVGSS